jgi:hypothetical protein
MVIGYSRSSSAVIALVVTRAGDRTRSRVSSLIIAVTIFFATVLRKPGIQPRH